MSRNQTKQVENMLERVGFSPADHGGFMEIQFSNGDGFSVIASDDGVFSAATYCRMNTVHEVREYVSIYHPDCLAEFVSRCEAAGIKNAEAP